MGSGVSPPLSPPETGKIVSSSKFLVSSFPNQKLETSKLNTELQSREVALVNMVKPHDQLVPVSFSHYWPSTSGLSTS